MILAYCPRTIVRVLGKIFKIGIVMKKGRIVGGAIVQKIQKEACAPAFERERRIYDLSNRRIVKSLSILFSVLK